MRELNKRPNFEVAQVIRQFGDDFFQQYRLPSRYWQTLCAIRDCRTSALGGHIDYCGECNTIQAISYNSCRNRHCPKCGGLQRELWMMARQEELLPVPYQHIVFTLPEQLNPWCLYNPQFCYNLLFKAAWETLRTFAADKAFLGAQSGATIVLHTWGQNLCLHPHVHCIVPAGGLVPGKGWKKPRRKSGFLFPVLAMSPVFKAIFLKAFCQAWKDGQLKLPPHTPTYPHYRNQWRNQQYAREWVVFAKPAFNSPGAVVEYLGRYTHKVAISNHRITSIDEHKVTFRYKDYRQKGQTKKMQLTGVEFLRRFCLHILPSDFRRMRHYGFLANVNKAKALAFARDSLDIEAPPRRNREERKALLWERWFGKPQNICPECGCVNSITRIPFGPVTSRAPPQTFVTPYQ